MKQFLLNGLKAAAILSLSLISFSATAQTNITVDAGAEWVGSVNVYDNTPEQPYLWSSTWGFEDLKAELNNTGNTITLYPNYNAYNATDAYWSNGAAGNKIMQTLPHVVDDNLVGQNVTFSGNVTSFTISDAYEVKVYMLVSNISPEGAWTPIAEVNQPITGIGNFTLNFNTAQYAATANHFEYGFQVKGINANPTTMEANGNVVITSDEPQVNEGTIVTIDTDSPLIGYANWYQLDGTTYVSGSEWGVPDLKTTVNSGNNTLTLQPNFSAYANANGDPYWVNGAIGNKVFEGNTYVQDDNLAGETITFKADVLSNTLATGYEAIAFIKVFNADYSVLEMTEAPLVAGETVSITSGSAAGSHIQYGFAVIGLNGNPTQESALGSAIVGPASLGVAAFQQSQVVIYPNPATTLLNIASADVVSTITVYNVLGQQVINKNVNAAQSTVDVSTLNSGIYIINTTVNGVVNSTRFVKQ